MLYDPHQPCSFVLDIRCCTVLRTLVLHSAISQTQCLPHHRVSHQRIHPAHWNPSNIFCNPSQPLLTRLILVGRSAGRPCNYSSFWTYWRCFWIRWPGLQWRWISPSDPSMKLYATRVTAPKNSTGRMSMALSFPLARHSLYNATLLTYWLMTEGLAVDECAFPQVLHWLFAILGERCPGNEATERGSQKRNECHTTRSSEHFSAGNSRRQQCHGRSRWSPL